MGTILWFWGSLQSVLVIRLWLHQFGDMWVLREKYVCVLGEDDRVVVLGR
jgi:hypothetical protein